MRGLYRSVGLINTLLVSLAVTGGVFALAGVPLRCWQFATGQFRSQVPRHALARATFSVFGFLFMAPNALVWTYALFTLYQYHACPGTCAREWAGMAVALGMLGCVYALLEGFLLTARRRPNAVTSDQ